jgi:PPOX class probable F420-dependent enzyme
MPLNKEEIEAFLKEPNIAVVATVTPDGTPHAVPTWYEYDEGEIVLHMGLGSRRYGNMKRNDNVTVCIDTRTPPYRAVIIEGRARMKEAAYQGTHAERMRRMAVRYLGDAAGNRYADSIEGQRTVIARVAPSRVTSWDYGRRDDP